MTADGEEKGERIAKRLSRAGICSRRDAERLIAEGRIMLNGKVLETPAVNVLGNDEIMVDGQPIGSKEPTRLWLYHKPAGLVTSHRDEKSRDTIFDHLPEHMPRVISVGRLDLNSEGLLLLTNDGELSRGLELPSAGWVRQYRARAYGRITQSQLDELRNGIRIDGISYGPIQAVLTEKSPGANVWIDVSLKEGKNREVRRVMEALGLKVNRLIRTAYGPFSLGSLPVGGVEEVGAKELKKSLGSLVS